jgi:hypothetical protein
METLADNGNGSYAYVDDLDEAQKLFVENLTSTLQVIALDATPALAGGAREMPVDFNPDVVAYYRLIGYENRDVADQDFRNDAVDAGEIGAGHSATALYAITFRPNADGRIATVQLRWEDPDTHQVTEINGNFNTWDLADSFEQADPAINWRWWSCNTPRCCGAAPGLPGPRPRCWSSRPTACRQSCGMIRKWWNLPAWLAGPVRSGYWGISFSKQIKKTTSPENSSQGTANLIQSKFGYQLWEGENTAQDQV